MCAEIPEAAKFIGSLIEVEISGCGSLTDAGLQHRSGLSALQTWDLSGCEYAKLQHLLFRAICASAFHLVS